MKPIVQLFFLIFVITLFSACQKPFLNPDGDYDANAKTFIDNAGITDATQKTAINDLTKQLKSSSLWSKFMAIYPMVGGTANTTKWNLKDPRNADAAYRLTFNGSPIFSTTGILFPTNSDYADTHLTDSMFSYNNNAISYYSRTQNSQDGYDIGCIDYALPFNEFAIYHPSDATEWFGFHAYGTAPSVTTGLFILSSTANDVKRYDNAVVTDSKGSAPVFGFTGKPVLIGWVLYAPSGGHRECSLATIGSGLTDQEVQTFDKIVKTFEASLGR
jgi:hypothetical protein